MAFRFQVEAYHRPGTIREAVDIMAATGSKARVLAGGTDLLVKKPMEAVSLVDISHLGLDGIEQNDQGVNIGAGTTINGVRRSPILASGPYRVLSEAAGNHSTATIRNMATIGGNLCNASPCADLALPLLVLDAILLAEGPEGLKAVPVGGFFRDVNQTGLDQADILVEIRIPCRLDSAGTSFLKLRRQQTAIDMALVNVATWLVMEGGVIREARIALGSVAPVPMRARQAESLLQGRAFEPDIIREAAQVAAAESKPIDDIRATASYRRKMTAVMVRRSLETSLSRCLS